MQSSEVDSADFVWRWKYYLVFVAILLILIVTVWYFYPETRGHTLEEIAIVFDGADAAAPTSSEILSRLASSKTKDGDVAHIEDTA